MEYEIPKLFPADRMLFIKKKQIEAGKFLAKLCQDRISKSFIIPALEKVCQIFWTRRLKMMLKHLENIGDCLGS